MPLDQRSRDKIAAIRKQCDAQIERIRKDERLSATGKRRAITRVYLPAKRKRDAIDAAAAQAHQNRDTAVSRTLFGVHGADPMGMVSYREAVGMVAEKAKEPGDAAGLMRQALRTGDTHLARAVFAHAFDQIPGEVFAERRAMWGDVVNAYLAENEHERALAVELGQLRDMNSRENRFAERLGYDITRPAELQGYSDAQLDQWEAEDLAAEGGQVA